MEFVGDRAKTYSYVKYIGTVPVQPQPLRAKCELVENNLFLYAPDYFKTFCNKEAGDYVVSNSTAEHLSRSIRKVDAPVVHRFREDRENFVKALDYVNSQFSVCFKAPDMDSIQILDETVLDSSSGVKFAQMGLPKKGDVLRADLHNLEFPHPNMEEMVLWKVSGKIEPRTRHDYVDEMKQRTFIIQPFDALWHTKKYYGNQNKAMKMVGDSYYGFNPYEGGVNRLAHSLLRHKRFWMLDGKGWDRLLPMMREIYLLRDQFKTADELLRWTRDNMINSYLVLPNGDVIYKEWGNNSGSGNTTCDNILGMDIVLGHVFSYLGYSKEEIKARTHIAIFGDDVVGGDSLTEVSDEKLEAAFRHVFTNLYGIVLDPFVITRDVTELSFLGFEFAKYCDWYVPAYPLEKLCASVRGNVKSMKVEAELAKFASLMLMSAGHGITVFNFFRNALLEIIGGSDHPKCVELRKSDLNITIPNFYSVMAWYIGFEGESFDSFFLWWSRNISQIVYFL
jgi:hypothetical protein